MTGSAGVDLRRLLNHPQPQQLMYQLREIVDERVYLQHGVSVEAGDIVLDVGANVGVAAAFFAVECGAVVHSFEPVTPIYDILCENIRSLPTCKAHNVGMSSSASESPIIYYPNADAMSGLHANPEVDRAFARTCMRNLGMSAEAADVALSGRYDHPVMLMCELRTISSVLDEHSIDRVRLLKIDVEHAELEVLLGISGADWPRIDQVVIEVHDKGGRLAIIAELLTDRGFTIAVEQEAAMRGTGLHLLYATRAVDDCGS
jgi:31-O-methyltransferase